MCGLSSLGILFFDQVQLDNNVGNKGGIVKRIVITALLFVSLITAQTITKAEWQKFLDDSRKNTRRLDRIEMLLSEAGSAMSTGGDLVLAGVIFQVGAGVLVGALAADGTVSDSEATWFYVGISVAGVGAILETVGIIVIGGAGNKLEKAERLSRY
jgi:CBS domain containing-hemolysin-like protein